MYSTRYGIYDGGTTKAYKPCSPSRPGPHFRAPTQRGYAKPEKSILVDVPMLTACHVGRFGLERSCCSGARATCISPPPVSLSVVACCAGLSLFLMWVDRYSLSSPCRNRGTQFNKHFHIWAGRFAYLAGVVQCYRGLELVSQDDSLVFSAGDGLDLEVGTRSAGYAGFFVFS